MLYRHKHSVAIFAIVFEKRIPPCRSAVAISGAINTESPAWAVDRLSILHLKIYHMKQETQRAGTDEAHRTQAQNKLNVLEEQLKDLSGSIEQLLADMAAGRKKMRVYKQMKMYNDPELNPVLYGTAK